MTINILDIWAKQGQQSKQALTDQMAQDANGNTPRNSWAAFIKQIQTTKPKVVRAITPKDFAQDAKRHDFTGKLPLATKDWPIRYR